MSFVFLVACCMTDVHYWPQSHIVCSDKRSFLFDSVASNVPSLFGVKVIINLPFIAYIAVIFVMILSFLFQKMLPVFIPIFLSCSTRHNLLRTVNFSHRLAFLLEQLCSCFAWAILSKFNLAVSNAKLIKDSIRSPVTICVAIYAFLVFLGMFCKPVAEWFCFPWLKV